MKHRMVLLCFLMIFMTGCWDNVEIQERGYVLGIAIDKPTPIPKGLENEKEYKLERDFEKLPLQRDKAQYAYTIQTPAVAFAKIKPSGQGCGGGQGDSTWELTILGNSVMEANRTLATRLDFAAYYEHLQSIVISEAVAKEGISKVLDFFLSDHEMRRRTKVFITPGEAKKVLDTKPRIEDYPSLYLTDHIENADRTSRILHKVDLGVLSEKLHSGTDFLIPRVVSTEDELKIAGAAVFKGDKMLGWLGEIDTIFTKFVRNTVEGGVIVIEDPKNPGALLTLEITKTKSKIRPKLENGKLQMKIDIKTTFNLAEKFESHYTVSLKDEYLKAMEKEAAEYMKREIIDTIKYVQKEFGADIFLFGTQVKRYKPQLWKEIKNDWEDIFRTLEVDLEIKTNVRQIGTLT